jgi:hypothetical protein
MDFDQFIAQCQTGTTIINNQYRVDVLHRPSGMKTVGTGGTDHVELLKVCLINLYQNVIKYMEIHHESS